MRYTLIISSNIQPASRAKEIMSQAIAGMCAGGCELLAYSNYCEPEPPYVNMAVDMESALDCNALNALCKSVEAKLGRTPNQKAQGICLIDIDPVICDTEILRPKEYGRPYFQLCYRDLAQRQSNG